MQRLFNVDKWLLVAASHAVSFANTNPRRIRLDVNSPGQSELFYSDGDGHITFLARVCGRDVIEFACYGAFDITVQGSDCYMYTIDGEDISFSIPGAVKLTKLVERRARNPELELMQVMMNRNLESRLAAQRDEMERILNRGIEAATAAAAQLAASADGAGVAPKPEPAGSAESGSGDKPADGGTGKSAE